MSDELSPEATASEPRRDPTSADHPAETGSEPTGSRAATPAAANGDDAAAAARRRRRRGSRGGRNRRKPAATGSDSRRDDGPTPVIEGGLTDTDAAAEARDDAGLTPDAEASAGNAKPKIGDRRPAPPATETAPSTTSPGRRRRRGGRGRSRTGAAAGSATATDAPTDDVVRADLGLGDAVDLEDLD